MARAPKANTNGELLVLSKAWEKLSKQEQKLVDIYVSTGNVGVALKQAGYAYSDEHRLFHDELIVSAIFSKVSYRIARGVCIGQAVLEQICIDTKAPFSCRIDAAKALRAPFIDHKLQQHGLDKPLTEHTIEELRALVDTLENQRSKDAKPVVSIEVAPVLRQSADNPLDLLG